ncbi:glycosyltransferase family 4 protein [Oceanibaculum pacificum]|uniref:Glycosyl transferase family 1 n=1 Tax=Oceanibaculum pacificum TaxID=580166 RepID=A0A154VGW1_9PROT|nr:glycosyltransferase family 4 protein [Oceanibaculum pacificum]KZD00611.1 glycosyl transferase family 1 [Oceanibaculum pacificum]
MTRRLLFLVTEDWYFWSHRLPQARAARDAGFEVLVATRIDRHGERIAAEGFHPIALPWRREGGLLGQLPMIAALVRLYRRERPDIVHHVALKPVAFGSLAARLAGVKAVVNAITGFGFLATSTSVRARAIRAAIGLVLPPLTRRRNARMILQNDDDLRLALDRRLTRPRQAAVIRGSGVDLTHYSALPEPEGPITIAIVSRMLRIKGVDTLVDAVRLLRGQGLDVRLLLAGGPDPANPASFDAATLRGWAAEPGVEWLGPVEDVRTVWARAHIAVLASRGGEGVPKSLLEAAACGRAIVATDVPGCRDVVGREGEAGRLTPPDDPAAMAEALALLARDGDLRRRLAAGARQRAEALFGAEAIGRETVALYDALLREIT